MKKLTLTNELFEQLSTSEAFKTRGGSGNVNGVTGAPGSCGNPIELDEVVVTPGVTLPPYVGTTYNPPQEPYSSPHDRKNAEFKTGHGIKVDSSCKTCSFYSTLAQKQRAQGMNYGAMAVELIQARHLSLDH